MKNTLFILAFLALTYVGCEQEDITLDDNTQEKIILEIESRSGTEEKTLARLDKKSHFIQDEQEEGITETASFFNQRYCEVILANINLMTGISLEAYNTYGCNTCPEEEWNALNTSDLKKEFHSPYVRLNGPRYWLMDSISSPTITNSCDVSFGELEMSFVASIPITLEDLTTDIAYKMNTVERNTAYYYNKGRKVYILEDPSEKYFIMQSYSQKVDANLQLEELETLGDRLNLPTEWSYKTIVLKHDLILQTQNDEAKLIADDLENAYQYLPDGLLY